MVYVFNEAQDTRCKMQGVFFPAHLNPISCILYLVSFLKKSL